MAPWIRIIHGFLTKLHCRRCMSDLQLVEYLPVYPSGLNTVGDLNLNAVDSVASLAVFVRKEGNFW